MGEVEFFEVKPKALNALSVKHGEAAFADLIKRLQGNNCESTIKKLDSDENVSSFLGAVFSLSPFLRDCANRDIAGFCEIIEKPLSETGSAILGECKQAGMMCADEASLMELLRKLKRKIALLCGLADLGGWWSGETVTATLSDFAEAAISATLDFILLQQEKNEKLTLADRSSPQSDCGLVVLGMGKLGAHELNYSSDIDVIIFFDQLAGINLHTDDPITLLSRMARQFIKILQERTGDGYVFRTDMRLRPDPSSTPLVLPVEAALNYYEGQGQNWERAAMIKARLVGGDEKAGEWFLNALSPFIWRKYLDYAAIRDVHSIKRQIHAHKGHDKIAVEGHNIKLGRGGIREIEFFAQTQQLIAGGRNTHLREKQTTIALERLAENGWIEAKVSNELQEAYWYLRNLEHRLQMVNDEQIHSLPEKKEELKRIALMCGEQNVETFSKQLTSVLKRVETRYAQLFETANELSVNSGNLVFTGDDDDPETLKTLASMGYERVSDIIKIIKFWHIGKIPALQTAQARELLTELVPSLLDIFANSGNPDDAFFAFDRFVSGLPAGIQLFSILNSNPSLTHLLSRILGSAPNLADTIARNPHVFDSMLDPRFTDNFPSKSNLKSMLDNTLSRAHNYELALDQARRFLSEMKFMVGVQYFNNKLSNQKAGHLFSDLAEAVISSLLELVCREFEDRHGRIKGSKICILAMGRLGSRELTATSDLDLIFLYDYDQTIEHSDGKKELAPSLYFIRLMQRFISAMSSPTSEGILYQLDFRLRPSGNAGPLATHVDAFFKYQNEQAWVWETQALTRCRPIAGDIELCANVESLIPKTFQAAIEGKNTASEIRGMRARILKEKGSRNIWDIKNVSGGLIDIEFIAQWLALQGVRSEEEPTATQSVILAAGNEVLSADQIEKLISAHELYSSVLHLERICLGNNNEIGKAPKGYAKSICQLMDLPDINACKAHLKTTQMEVRETFETVFSPKPAKG